MNARPSMDNWLARSAQVWVVVTGGPFLLEGKDQWSCMPLRSLRQAGSGLPWVLYTSRQIVFGGWYKVTNQRGYRGGWLARFVTHCPYRLMLGSCAQPLWDQQRPDLGQWRFSYRLPRLVDRSGIRHRACFLG